MKRNGSTIAALLLCSALLLQMEAFCACRAEVSAKNDAPAKSDCPSCGDSQPSGAGKGNDDHQPPTECCCRFHEEDQPRQLEVTTPLAPTALQIFVALDAPACDRTDANDLIVAIRSHSPPPSDFKIPLYLSKASLLI